MNEKGILVFAVGHPSYGRLAYNLAMTILSVDPNAEIAVVRSPKSLNHLSEGQKELFSHVIDAPEEMPIGCGCKLWADKLTPFKKTLLLDADMVWLPRKTPNELFEILKDVDFTGITEGFHDYETNEDNNTAKYFFWADVAEIAAKYKIKATKIYQWRSEVLYFEKTKQIEAMFRTARKIFAKPGLTSIKAYANGVADELAINVAAAMHNIEPHQYRWQPSYWYVLFGGAIPDFAGLYGKYFLASFGSNISPKPAQDLYNRIVKSAAYKIGHQHVFPLVSKREWLTQRQKM